MAIKVKEKAGKKSDNSRELLRKLMTTDNEAIWVILEELLVGKSNPKKGKKIEDKQLSQIEKQYELLQKLMATDNESIWDLLEQLLKESAPSPKALTPMSLEEFYKRIEQSEREKKEGLLISHDTVKAYFKGKK